MSIAQALGLTVVAEGAENWEQISCLAQMGCDQVQGFFIQRPMPLDRVGDWLASQTHAQCPSAEVCSPGLADLTRPKYLADPRFSLRDPERARA